MRTHEQILSAERVRLAKARCASGMYENDSVIDIAAERLHEDLRRRDAGIKPGDGLPVAAAPSFRSPDDGDGVGALTDSRQRLAVAEPMQNFEATPVFTGHANELCDECDDVIATRARENEVADCLLWIACGVVVFLLLAVTA